MPKTEIRTNLIRLREAKGWSQEKLAQEAKLSTMAVVQIETGRRLRPRIDTIEKLAKALDCKLSALTGEGSEHQGNSPLIPDMSSAIQVLQRLQALPAARKQYVLALIYDDPRYLQTAQLRQAYLAAKKSV